MKDPLKLKELIIEKVPLVNVMIDYGVEFQYNPTAVSEVQLKCPFHGRDTKPSARLYNTTSSFFCWVCRKSWNVVSFIMDRESLSFKQALSYLANRYKVDLSVIPDTPTIELKVNNADNESTGVLFKKVHKNILEIRKKIPFEKYRVLCAVYCNARYQDYCGENVFETLKKIEDKIICLS